MENQIKGLAYEEFICKHLNNEGQTWMWDKIPEKHLIDSGLIHKLNEHRLDRKKHLQNLDEYKNPLRDTGIDLLLMIDNEYIFVQCKNGYKNGLMFEHLLGFNIMIANHETKYGRVYYTNKLSTNVKEIIISKRITYIKKTMPEPENKIIIKPKIIYKLRDYQIIAYGELIEHFEAYSRGILSLPCGTGKTILSCYFARMFDSVILLSPLKQYAEQNADKYNEKNNIAVEKNNKENIKKH